MRHRRTRTSNSVRCPEVEFLLNSVYSANQGSERDDEEAISESNILDEKTRGAKPEAGTYKEPSDVVPGLED